MKPLPFHVKRENGLVMVDSAVDSAFRKALMDGVPAPLRGKMVEALSAQLLPNAFRAQKEARRLFGQEADIIFGDASRFAEHLHKFLGERFGLVGLLEWLTVTGYGNDYRMIKVFAEWARTPVARAAEALVKTRTSDVLAVIDRMNAIKPPVKLS